jgi:hypothetical protein
VQKAGENFGFATVAWKIMQLGNFSPGFFGPVSEYQFSGFAALEVAASHQQADNPQVRGAAVFLHFDNLSGELKSNSQFDALFNHLLQNTQNALASYNRLRIDDRVRKTLVLVTLGASLHAVQDFYLKSAHSNEVRYRRLHQNGCRLGRVAHHR